MRNLQIRANPPVAPWTSKSLLKNYNKVVTIRTNPRKGTQQVLTHSPMLPICGSRVDSSGQAWLDALQTPSPCCGGVFGLGPERWEQKVAVGFSVSKILVCIISFPCLYQVWVFEICWLVVKQTPKRYLWSLCRFEVLSLLVALTSVGFACYVFFVPGRWSLHDQETDPWWR